VKKIKMNFGIDILLQHPEKYKQLHLGLVTNDAALTSSGISSRVALQQKGFQLIRLFSPEHGIARTGEDGILQKDGTDPLTQLPIISLYGDKMAPNEADLAEIDGILFDIPDIGCRFYTYLWTMTHVMEACARYGKTFILLDRPNPIGINLSKAEGPMLNEANCSSFIGRWNIPLKHCCTLGELCRYFAATRLPQLKFDIIPLKNYKRSKKTPNFEFTPTSPAIQNIETAILYPGMGLLEGINVNEGRGTEKPFQKCAAQWLKNEFLCEKMQKLNISGIVFSITGYTPASGLYAGRFCKGLKWRLTDSNSFKAVKTGIALLQTIMQLHPEHIAERLYITHANPTGEGHLDKLLGVPGSFDKLKRGEKIETDVAEEWAGMIKPYLLY
jgi:uncharacterized protein YbbC (DUF1343 family)